MYQIRCESAILFKSYSSKGELLRPREALRALEERRLHILAALASKTQTSSMVLEYQVVNAEIEICEKYFEKRRALSLRNRRSNNNKAKLNTILAYLDAMEGDDIKVIQRKLTRMMSIDFREENQDHGRDNNHKASDDYYYSSSSQNDENDDHVTNYKSDNDHDESIGTQDKVGSVTSSVDNWFGSILQRK